MFNTLLMNPHPEASWRHRSPRQHFCIRSGRARRVSRHRIWKSPDRIL